MQNIERSLARKETLYISQDVAVQTLITWLICSASGPHAFSLLVHFFRNAQELALWFSYSFF